jgi:long-chain acyl-CoA synthetase
MKGQESLAQLLVNQASARPQDTALRFHESGRQSRRSWQELLSVASSLAWMMKDQGVGPGQRVLVLGETSRITVECLFAVWMADAVAVPLPHTLKGSELLPIMLRVNPALILVTGPATLKEMVGYKGTAPVVYFGPTGRTGGRRFRGSELPTGTPEPEELGFSFQLAEDLAGDTDPGFQRVPEYGRGAADDAVLLFTPGTGGTHKGLFLSHQALLTQARILSGLMGLTQDDTQLLVLPLSYILGLSALLCSVQAGSPLAVGGGQRSMVEDMGLFSPAFVVGVPSMFERLADRLRAGVGEFGYVERQLFHRWVEAGIERLEKSITQGDDDFLDYMERMVAEKLFFPRIRSLFGGTMRFFLSAGAPVSRQTVLFFHALGVPLYESYGLTETAGATHVSSPGAFKAGSVGVPIPGVEVRIADDGEVLVKTPTMMTRYLDEGDSGYCIQDGWLHTGDLGFVDESGFLFITGRKKDLLVTSGGAIISPTKLESRLDRLPLVSRSVVFGDGKAWPVALITLDEEELHRWYAARGLEFRSLADAAGNVDLYVDIEQSVKRINAELAAPERIKRIAVLPSRFGTEDGELTPHHRLRRARIAEKYAGVLKTLYE